MQPTILTLGTFWGVVGLLFFSFFLLAFFCVILGVFLMNSPWYSQKVDALDKKKRQVSEYKWSRKQKGEVILSILFFILASTYFVPQFFLFNKVLVYPNNQWVLKNSLGVTVGVILPQEPRRLELMEFERTVTRPYKKYPVREIGIISAKKVHRSIDTDVQKMRAIIYTLDERAKEQGVLSPKIEKKNGWYDYDGKLRIILVGLMVVVWWWFWRGRKI